jgi:MFS transporter, DHA1 family, multidrug resistance protein
MVAWKRNLIFIWLSQFLSIGGFSLALPFAPFFIQDLGVTDPAAVKYWAALSQSVTGVSLAFMAPLWGVLADRHGRKLMMLRANFSAVLVLAAMAGSPNVYVFVALRFVQGMFTGTINAAMTFVATSAPQDRQGTALGALSAAVFSGNMIGPFLGGFLADWLGYRLTFIAAAVMLLLSAFMVLFWVQERFVPPALTAQPVGYTWRQRLAALGPGAPILVLLFFMSSARSFDGAILPLYVQQIHGRLEGASRWTGMLSGVAAVGAMLAGVFLGRLADRVRPPLIGTLSALGAGVSFFACGLLPTFAALFPLRFALAFCGGGLDPVFQVWLSRMTPEHRRGTIFGWAVTAKSIGWALSPMLSGLVAVNWGITAVYFVGPLLFFALIPLINRVSARVAAL